MSTKKQLTAEDAINAFRKAKDANELEKAWKKYEDCEFGPRCGEVSQAYHQRLLELENAILYGDTVYSSEKPKQDRRSIWEVRIKEFRTKIREEESKTEGAKIVVKTHKQATKALKQALFELLDAGPDGFEIDSTPLLTLAELEAELAARNEKTPEFNDD